MTMSLWISLSHEEMFTDKDEQPLQHDEKII